MVDWTDPPLNTWLIARRDGFLPWTDRRQKPDPNGNRAQRRLAKKKRIPATPEQHQHEEQ